MRSPSNGRATAPVSPLQAIALGSLQGPTELLPVSSSGHLTIVPWLLGWEYQQLDDELRKSFEVLLHAGAAAAMVIGDHAELRESAAELGERALALLALSCAPAALAGFALERPIERRFGNPLAISGGLAGGALAMALCDRAPQARRQEAVDARDALWLGIAQACALIPGVSRNGATLAVARVRHFRRNDADRLSRLVALPVIAGAALLKGIRLRRRAVPDDATLPFAIGGSAAFASALISALLIRRLEPMRLLLPCAAYRVMLAGAILARLSMNHLPGSLRSVRWPRMST
jgi:undecaprenyl-diphosphatase